MVEGAVRVIGGHAHLHAVTFRGAIIRFFRVGAPSAANEERNVPTAVTKSGDLSPDVVQNCNVLRYEGELTVPAR